MASAYRHGQSVALRTRLTDVGVHSIINSDETWYENIQQYQKRIKSDPACIAFPKEKGQIAQCLKCAREAHVKVTALGPGHSFQGLGFGFTGNLVISMQAFDSVSYDESTTLLTYGGGTRVGPVANYLWKTARRHFPHVRGSNVGLTGSSIGCGFGTTSRLLGTPMDNIVSMDFMLYDGTVVTATKGSDLLWAAKGAAASYGIILSATTKTFKPKFDRAVKFIVSLGDIGVHDAAKAFIAIQTFGTSSKCPDELAIRWSLVNWTTKEKEELDFWDMEVEISGQAMDGPDGGDLNALSFYTQSLVMTTDYPLNIDQARVLLSSTTLAFDRTDMTKMGYIDLWTGVSRGIGDEDTGYPHGKNLWLIRWDGNAVDSESFPADGVAYMKSLMEPFENLLIEAGVPLRGFVNYADTELSQEELASRLYGDNYDRLVRIKGLVDPEGLFTNNILSIPLQGTSDVIRGSKRPLEE
ncbi:hypothetical protein ACHAP5_007971 [Fusarium lateritium]